MISDLRGKDGGLALDRCFQGSKRFERQCGPLRQCCSAYDGCKKLVKRSLISKKKEALLREIRNVAKKCKEGAYQEDKVTAPDADEVINPEGPSTLIIFTNQTDSDDVVENFLHKSPQQWYMALKAKLKEKAQNSIFQKHTTVSYNEPKTDKNDGDYHTLQNIINK
ncbi:unnamed protein product [Onchocerca flexuosa]|uniref:DB module n=1 Tax=Onchocerca flexuosa TaxID=387005 RepID=A0A183HDZ5_9BILA|nr:unnamed protein product [Onchocerca flexuosa]